MGGGRPLVGGGKLVFITNFDAWFFPLISTSLVFVFLSVCCGYIHIFVFTDETSTRKAVFLHKSIPDFSTTLAPFAPQGPPPMDVGKSLCNLDIVRKFMTEKQKIDETWIQTENL